MKLSFSIPSKSSSRPPLKPTQSFNPSGDHSYEDGRHDQAKPHFVTVFDPSENPSSNYNVQRVITPIPNSDSRFHAKMKNLSLPFADDPPTESRFVLDNLVNGSSEIETNRYGLTLRSNGTVAKSQEDDALLSEKRRFHELIKDLPDDELPDVPVEGFGAAILAGYGWTEGKPIGRNSKEDPKVFEYKRRAGTEGFGYTPQAPNLGGKRHKEDVAAQVKSIKEKSVHADDRDERKRKNRDGKKASKDRCEEISKEKRQKYNVTLTAEKSSVRWLRNHIRVRIISKKFGAGKLYLKKGEVVDVVGPKTCDIRMDGSGELVQGVDQGMLETALPKHGGSVLVLYGKHEGVLGSLVERDSVKETGLVRDLDSHALINVLLEQIAEYVGDPSYLGY